MINVRQIFTKLIDTDEFTSLPSATTNAIFSKHSISSWIKPTVEYENYIECNDGYFGIGFEIQPLLRSGTSSEEKFESILNSVPDDMLIQIQLYGSQNIDRVLKLWEHEHLQRDNEAVQKIVKRFVKFLEQKTHEPLTKNIKTTLKDIRVFITLKHKNEYEIKKIAKDIENSLETSQFFPEKLDFKKLKEIYYELFNPHIPSSDYPAYDNFRYLNKQSVAANQTLRVHNRYFEIGTLDDEDKIKGKTWIALALQKLPITDYEGVDITDFSLKIGDIQTGTLNDKQFNDSFIISLNLQRCNEKEVTKVERVQKHLNRSVTKNTDTALNEKKKEVNSVISKLNKNEPLFKMDITVMVAGNDKQSAFENAKRVERFWDSGFGSIKITPAAFVHHNLFLSSIPFGIGGDYFTKIQANPYYLFVDNITPFLPIEADWNGNYPHILGVSRRGELVGVDLFKTSEGFNAYMLGTTGAGKSALLNWILFCHYARGGKAFILDMGDSYSSLIEQVGGVFIQPDIKEPISFNPFATIKNVEKLEEYLSFLTSFLYMIGANKEVTTRDKEFKYISGKIESTIKKIYIDDGLGAKMEITDIRDDFLAEGDPRLKDFAIHISPFCKGGKYEKFYTGETKFDFDHDLVGVDLTKLRNDHDLGVSLIFIANYFFSEAVYNGEVGQELLALIDEFHKHMGKNPHLDHEVDEAYRTYRKHGAAMIVGSQGFNDYVDTISRKKNPIGDVVLGNSAWGFFGKQKEVARNLVINSGLFEFDDIDKNNIRTVQGIKGQYSEFMVFDPYENKIPVRFIFEPSFLLTVSTDKDDKKAIREMMKRENLSRGDAIDQILKNRGVYE